MRRRTAKKPRFVKIRINHETWSVPFKFGRAYRNVAKEHFALLAAGEPGTPISAVISLLALIGYVVTPQQVADWDLRRRVEAMIYAATEHARASDNLIPRHPKPSWLPDPWKGTYDNSNSVWSGARATPVEP